MKSDKINKITEKKYLFISFLSKEKFKKKCLFIKIFLGLTCEIKSLSENLNKEYNLKNLIPELVEKKEPPIIDNIKKIKERLLGELFRDTPIFETLLHKDKKIILKL
tara:strand:+ start:286 stop:606 length:321 start_codon:yes stop_codon:yes gene_type:complete